MNISQNFHWDRFLIISWTRIPGNLFEDFFLEILCKIVQDIRPSIFLGIFTKTLLEIDNKISIRIISLRSFTKISLIFSQVLSKNNRKCVHPFFPWFYWIPRAKFSKKSSPRLSLSSYQYFAGNPCENFFRNL